MFEYKPERSSDTLGYDAIGSLASDFEAFRLHPKYTWEKPPRVTPGKDAWKIVVPKTAPIIGELPQIVQNVIKMTWKFAEPSKGAQRGDIMIGTRIPFGRGMPNGVQNQAYHSQVRPTKQMLPTGTPNDAAIAADWKVFQQIKRTNAVTFRGDSRPPREVINEMGGFTPPISRTDRYYIENNLYNAFSDYLERRYDRKLGKDVFLRAVDAAAPTAEDQKLLVDYMMWRKLTEREAVHLGRMVENECQKGYISTSRSIDSSLEFATRHLAVDGWLYVTVVHSGFIVPWGSTAHWGSEEAEIAQWGPIPSSRIVGFVGVTKYCKPRTPIFMRRSFRKNENAAFEYMYKVMSGMTP